MLTKEQVSMKAPLRGNMKRSYAHRRLWCLKSESQGYPGIAALQGFRIEIGSKGGEELTQGELKKILSDEALERFTQFINNSIDILIDKVFGDGKEISEYIEPRILLPDFLEAMVINLNQKGGNEHEH